MPQDGSIRVPPALQPFVGRAVLTRPPAPLLRYIGPNQPGGGPRGGDAEEPPSSPGR